jgi:uncharacterized protein DUF4440
MTDAALLRPTEDEVREAERRRLRSLVDRDMATAHDLHAPDYELIPPGGQTIDRASYLGGIEAENLRYEIFEAEGDVRVRTWPGGGAARYRARIRIAYEGGFDAALVWHTDLYELRDGRLQATWSQATRIRTLDGD